MNQQPQENPGGTGGYQLLHMLMAAAVMVAFVGLVAGSQRPPEQAPTPPRTTPTVMEVPQATDYAGLRAGTHLPNAAWRSQVRALDEEAQAIPSGETRDRARGEALTARASRRAYDGAPPTIPHAIHQLGVPACLACHGEGMVVGDKVAPKMSHPVMTSCPQCHAPSEGVPAQGWPADEPALSDGNLFVGLAPVEEGTRAWPGAPPTIPHATHMRERCDSCHSRPHDQAGIATSHPERSQCLQCHAPSGLLETGGLFEASAPFTLEARP